MADATVNEITVSPQAIIMNRHRTFMVSGLDANIRGSREQGLFMHDTRFLSHYRLRINGRPWQLVTSASLGHAAAQFEFTSPALAQPGPAVPKHVLGLTLTRTIEHSVQEELAVVNYHHAPIQIVFAIAIGCDFADLFEVRRNHLRVKRRISTTWNEDDQELTTEYVRGSYAARFRYHIKEAPARATYSGHTLSLGFTLAPHQRRRLHVGMIPETRMARSGPESRGRVPSDPAPQAERAENPLAQFHTSDRVLSLSLAQSAADLVSLVMRDRAGGSPGVLAAGVPWFVALFGRDAIIAGLQTLPLHPGFALGALEALAAYQATHVDDFRDAAPGKILHELRVGELAQFGEIPHSPYYGSADATILYPILLHETYAWTGRRALLKQYMPVAQRCLEWADQYGDLDGDGFQEYLTHSKRGIKHQGWKDSGDGTVYADGRQVEPPVALCELQGYLYDAKRRMAALYNELGDEHTAEELHRAADRLAAEFNAAFWLETEGTYAFGLDSHKRPITSVVSNAGHCLWSGIAPADRAPRVIARLLADDMWSGWGIRTLSAAHPAFNPFAYQRGAVWPHDNLLIAAGCRRYGDLHAASRIAAGIFDAAAAFQGHHIPELIGGQARSEVGFPVWYLGANIPQAWAAGSISAFIAVLLGLRPDARRRRLYISPRLPSWLDWVEVRGLTLGDARVTLRCRRDQDETRIEACATAGQVDVLREEVQFTRMPELGTP